MCGGRWRGVGRGMCGGVVIGWWCRVMVGGEWGVGGGEGGGGGRVWGG